MWEARYKPKLKCTSGFKNALSPIGIPLKRAPQVLGDKLDSAEAGDSLEVRPTKAKEVDRHGHLTRMLGFHDTHVKRQYLNTISFASLGLVFHGLGLVHSWGGVSTIVFVEFSASYFLGLTSGLDMYHLSV